ncbi:MAG: hypothetical protein ABSA71_16460 [Desulfomonilia bacterium]|jgi:hypothetical protein
MTKRKDSTVIEGIHPACCGLDVHKESVSACLLYPGRKSVQESELRLFGTYLDDMYEVHLATFHLFHSVKQR